MCYLCGKRLTDLSKHAAKRYPSFNPCGERRRDGGFNFPWATSWQDWIPKALIVSTAVLQLDKATELSDEASVGSTSVGDCRLRASEGLEIIQRKKTESRSSSSRHKSNLR